MSDSNDNAPVEPIDQMVAHANKWLDNLEQKLADAKKQKQTTRDDIPTFTTRHL